MRLCHLTQRYNFLNSRTFLKQHYMNHEYFTDHDNTLETLADVP